MRNVIFRVSNFKDKDPKFEHIIKVIQRPNLYSALNQASTLAKDNLSKEEVKIKWFENAVSAFVHENGVEIDVDPSFTQFATELKSHIFSVVVSELKNKSKDPTELPEDVFIKLLARAKKYYPGEQPVDLNEIKNWIGISITKTGSFIKKDVVEINWNKFPAIRRASESPMPLGRTDSRGAPPPPRFSSSRQVSELPAGGGADRRGPPPPARSSSNRQVSAPESPDRGSPPSERLPAVRIHTGAPATVPPSHPAPQLPKAAVPVIAPPPSSTTSAKPSATAISNPAKAVVPPPPVRPAPSKPPVAPPGKLQLRSELTAPLPAKLPQPPKPVERSTSHASRVPHNPPDAREGSPGLEALRHKSSNIKTLIAQEQARLEKKPTAPPKPPQGHLGAKPQHKPPTPWR